MTESEGQPSPEPVPIERARHRRAARRGGQRWDIEAVAYHLQASTAARPDPELGEGHRLLIGLDEKRVTALELYPSLAKARVRTKDILIELSKLAPPLITKEELAPDQESILLIKQDASAALRLGLNAQGDIGLTVAPREALEAEPSPSARPVESTGPQPRESKPEKEAQERIAVKGRVGAEPTFRTTAKGVVVARFPIAEHQGEATTWHRVVVFGTRAENLREALEKGQEVEVVGYVHERPARSGEAKIIQEIYAAVVNADRPNR